ncbi:hypothetical protein HPP92_018517 [Vanilla planifolia]|nr:hypothetical protein HPP92_018517 [Vanilla planifolia]
MARILSLARKPLFQKTVALSDASMIACSRSYISEMRRSTLKDNLLRILRTEITYES